MLIKINSFSALSGQTTLAVNLAAGLEQAGNNVLLIISKASNLVLDWLNQVCSLHPQIELLCLNLNYETTIDGSKYNYIVWDSNTSSHLNVSPELPCINLLCLDLNTIDHTMLNNVYNEISSNTFIIPCKVKFKEWEKVELIDIIANKIGEDMVSEAIPY